LAAPFLFIALAMVEANQKQPPPDEAAQAKAEKQIKEIFKEDYAKTKPADLKALSAKLLKQARDTNDDPAARYVLFREAADLAAHAGDAVTAIQVVGEWARSFAIDERVMKSEKLLAANKAAGSNTDLKNVADAALTLVEEAVATDDYATALRLIVAAHDAAKHGGHSALAKQIEARSIDLKAMEREYPAVKEALETLAAKPDDADACRLAGKFLCYWKGDWDKGLAYLAKGFNDELGLLARKDRANPMTAAEMVEVADGWWNVAESLPGSAKVNVLRRAMGWYQDAVPSLSGLNRTKVEQRIKAAAEMLPEEPVGEVREMVGHQGVVHSVAIAPNGLWAASSGYDRTIRLWDLATGKEMRRYAGHSDWVGGIGFTSDGKQLISCSGDHTIRVWDVETGKEVRQIPVPGPLAFHLQVTPDGKGALSCGQDHAVCLWDLENGKEARRFVRGQDQYCCAVSADGSRVLSGGGDMKLDLWDLATGRELRRMSGHTGHIYCCAFSRDGKLAASGGSDKIIRLWNLESGKSFRQLKGHTSQVNRVVFSPNGRYLLSASNDNTLRLWSVATGQEVQRFNLNQSGTNTQVVFSPDGRRFLSGGNDGVVRLWAVPK
jgi:WD40 repeat protein